MFEFNPAFVNEGEEIDGDICDSRLREQEEGEEEYEIHDIDISAFDVGSMEGPEVDDATLPADEMAAANEADSSRKGTNALPVETSIEFVCKWWLGGAAAKLKSGSESSEEVLRVCKTGKQEWQGMEASVRLRGGELKFIW
ncbi:unnamed protein product [Hydatigera taeniaeformis]|uniref:Uncharacterized protein n=1 Tax=Hydatigena taeniaeformis TaxID=6205 RepID=A0A0R3XCV4_HYDTA|nr:unnamed protein product [Hydatigera taeniaeformis]